MRAVVVPDPDNERGHLVVDGASGKVLARGHLEVNGDSLWAEPGDAPRSGGVRFVEASEQGADRS